MGELNLEIITPSKIGYKGSVTSVTVPGTKGNFQVLFNHAPIISSLEIGEIKIVDKDKKKFLFATSGGTIEVSNNKIIVLAESLERSDQIDIKRAEEAKQRAQDRLHRRTETEIDDIRAEYSLKRAINRLKISHKEL
ncbi:MAG: F0F1 ATP synthase subunit epsilon [Ignavibacteriae bacterium]|nr:F0F1 ATP synthase subunit epsilon [Ignavibacteriota bacterium]MCB9206684.1 F0F1 ATP synthase subunit epsilon [Ignavibacteriales bacterium]MCB9218797.1 F0F1 ATP synthase subunit epsilon [Ignavibacteriales bacterium]MCB9259199.1 F0F1 ATP synthase subunit epsilon [Ignavibacteriales bacterium]